MPMPGSVHRRATAAALLFALAAACGGARAAQSAYHPPPVAPRTVLAYTIAPKACQSWMGGTMVATCDPQLLVRVYDDHRMREPSTLQVTVAGRRVRSGGNPALTQVLPDDGRGEIIGPGNTITLTGTVSAGSVLYVRASAMTPRVFAMGDALFAQLGLERGGKATITIDVAHNHLHYTLHRADGTTRQPVRVAGMGGPGTAVAPAAVPSGYADNPRQTATTYIAAVNARDGQTLCSLFTTALRARYATILRTPCWATVSSFIDFTGENAERAFKSVHLVTIGKPRRQSVGAHRYLGVPLKLDIRFVRAPTAGGTPRFPLREAVEDVLWLERDGGSWRIAKPSLALMTATAVAKGSGDPLAPPRP
jgi:hypothetical protein